ncbi:MAG: FAD-binding oxidoreductase [Ktedonobacteraceae bacterium]
MSSLRPKHWAVTRPPRGSSGSESLPEMITDREQLKAVLHDAAYYPGGNASLLVRPHNEFELANIVRRYPRILPIGVQSSLTGGATPMGEVVLDLSRLASILEIRHDSVRVQAGLPLSVLQESLAREDKYYPPVPSYDGASVGGTIATNAAGPATFKYGSVRTWVQAISVVLASGEVLDLERGQCLASPAGYFEIEGAAGVMRIPLPTYSMPHVPKCSAGYYAAPGMDLLDLFIGSEGTLGIITEATLRIVTPAPALCLAFIPCVSEARALEMTQKLRALSLETRLARSTHGLDVRAIEYLDARSLQIVREDGSDRRNGFVFQPDVQALLLVHIELPAEYVERAYDDLAQALEPGAPDVPLVSLARLLDTFDALQETELVMPAEHSRAAQVYAIREAVPAGVNARIIKSKRELHNDAITKVAADMIVPFEHLPGMLQLFRESFEARDLDYAIWGHISDGNMHPNLLPHTVADIKAGQQIVLECGRAVTMLGGSPLAEHGVGRSLIKKELLMQLYGEEGYKQMYAVKQALDPTGKLAPGNLFSSITPD